MTTATIPSITADWTILVPILGGLVGILAMALRAFLRLQRRQEERDDAMAERERKNLQIMEDISRPLRQIPPALEAHRAQLAEQGEALRVMRKEQQDAYRTLSQDIREAGAAARETTRELLMEIRSIWRGPAPPGNHRA